MPNCRGSWRRNGRTVTGREVASVKAPSPQSAGFFRNLLPKSASQVFRQFVVNTTEPQ